MQGQKAAAVHAAAALEVEVKAGGGGGCCFKTTSLSPKQTKREGMGSGRGKMKGAPDNRQHERRQTLSDQSIERPIKC